MEKLDRITFAGDRPPRYGKKRHPRTVGRGPVPRHASRHPTIAGDRPPRYGEKTASPHRRARACPSPCFGLLNARGGQAPALRAHRDQEVQNYKGIGILTIFGMLGAFLLGLVIIWINRLAYRKIHELEDL